MQAGPCRPTVLKRDITPVGEGHCVYGGQGNVGLPQQDKIRLKMDVYFLTSPIQADVHIFTWTEDMHRQETKAKAVDPGDRVFLIYCSLTIQNSINTENKMYLSVKEEYLLK